MHKLTSNKWAFALDFGFSYDPTYMSTNFYKVTKSPSGGKIIILSLKTILKIRAKLV